MNKPEAVPARSAVTGVQKMTPSEAFVETLVANNVTDIFGFMGSALMDAMDIFAPAGIRLIPVVHEQGAGHMADGYARVSGRHGVVIGQNARDCKARCWLVTPPRPLAPPPYRLKRRHGNKSWTAGPTKKTPSAWT